MLKAILIAKLIGLGNLAAWGGGITEKEAILNPYLQYKK
jgi:hypothetical protein